MQQVGLTYSTSVCRVAIVNTQCCHNTAKQTRHQLGYSTEGVATKRDTDMAGNDAEISH